MTTDPIKLSAADILQMKANDLAWNEADAIPVGDRTALCCAVDHPLSWTSASGEQFTITKPEVQDGAVYTWVTAVRNGAEFYHDDHIIRGLNDVYLDRSSGKLITTRDWVLALRHIIENAVLS